MRLEKEIIVFWSQTSTIIPTLVSYNCYESLPTYITDHMADNELGEFGPTINCWEHACKKMTNMTQVEKYMLMLKHILISAF
uniref:Uncharacterized protein n=1 Tax=Nelumbo nucifera TaxID=4432 RepID=A0A822ZYP1_NELNU|nr:TPA_asm: hypothetical protein HUJ06_017894 [Nelumbo nucifera]